MQCIAPWHLVLHFEGEYRFVQYVAGIQEQTLQTFREEGRHFDLELWKTALLANEAWIDADLGGGVIKQRIARSGEGKSGGSRAVILFRRNDRAVYVYGFEKKDLGNIRADELEAFRELAEVILGYSITDLAKRVRDGALFMIEASEDNHYAI